MAVSQLKLENPKITDKVYFTCYNNPFNRFGLDALELQWHSKMYNEDSILIDMTTVILFSDRSEKFTMIFYQKNIEVVEIKFIIMEYDINKIRLRIPDVNIEMHKGLNCSKFIDDYYFYIDKRELFYGDNKILSWGSGG